MNLDDFDLVGYKIISPFHMAALNAYADRLGSSVRPLKILVILSKGPWQKKIEIDAGKSSNNLHLTFIDEDKFSTRQSTFWPLLITLKPLAAFLTRFFGMKRVTICSPTMACLKLSTSSIKYLFLTKPVIIDEGLGSFNTAHLFKLEAEQLTDILPFSVAISWIFHLLWTCFPIFGGSRETLFRFRSGRPVLNELVADSYRKVFSINYAQNEQHPTIAKNTVLVLTQAFVELGLCSDEEMIQELIPWVSMVRRAGKNPMLKPHPAEDLSKYLALDADIIDYSGAVEELFAANSENIVQLWGFTSTSLITGNALFKLDSKRMPIPWGEPREQKLTTKAKNLLEAHTEILIREPSNEKHQSV